MTTFLYTLNNKDCWDSKDKILKGNFQFSKSKIIVSHVNKLGIDRLYVDYKLSEKNYIPGRKIPISLSQWNNRWNSIYRKDLKQKRKPKHHKINKISTRPYMNKNYFQ